MTQFIKNLVSKKYSVFNVNNEKAPCTSQGIRMNNWIGKSFDELCQEHNYESKLWGMKMGLQENDKSIMSLDFDICGKKGKDGVRIGCPHAIIKLNEYIQGTDNENGMYSSSTEGNMNVLIDYTNSPQIKDWVKQVGGNKFNHHELEILLGGNQVIPPSATISKLTGVIGNPRTFKNPAVPFYEIQETEDCFVFGFIKKLFIEKLETKPILRINSPVNPPVNTTVNSTVPSILTPLNNTDKFLELLNDVIKNERDGKGCKIISRDDWFKICGILKYNNYKKEDWLNYSQTISKTTTASNTWDCIKNITPMNIYGLQNIAKSINPVGYKLWLKKWNPYYISDDDLKDTYKTSTILMKTLKETLILCNENWYMLTTSQLWKQQKTPDFYITTELRKYIDESNKKIVAKIAMTDGEEKDKLIGRSKNYLKAYKEISSSSYLTVLIKYLKPQLTNDLFANQLDNNKGKLAFKNGIMDLETKIFRNGILWNDFITDTIQYDYIPSTTEYIKSVLLKILNNNTEHLEYYLSLIGYSFIGDPDLEKSIYFMIDKTDCGRGDNGKTFFFDILTSLMPYYVYKTKSSFLEKDNKKIHKQLAMLKGKRTVWMDEMPKEKDTNADLIKELADGKQIENEVMFGTSETINIMFKVFALSNNIPKINSNEQAVFNRYKQVSFNSHFDRKGERLVENPDKLLFIADTNLTNIIKEKYYNEVLNLVIDYAHKYYKNNKKLPAIPLQFVKDTKETQSTNDIFGSWFNDNCELITTERVALKMLVKCSEMDEKMIKEGMMRKGFKYEKDLRSIGKDLYGKAYKGGYNGVKININDDETDEEC